MPKRTSNILGVAGAAAMQVLATHTLAQVPRLIGDLIPGPDPISSDATGFVQVGNAVIFNQFGLYASDLDGGNPRLLAPKLLQYPVRVGGHVVLNLRSGCYSCNPIFWTTDGTPESTHAAANGAQFGSLLFVRPLGVLNGRLIGRGTYGTASPDPYSFDPVTNQFNFLTNSWNTGPSSPRFQGFAVGQSRGYFVNETGPSRLHATDGSPAGTSVVFSSDPAVDVAVVAVAARGDDAIFVVQTYDGTSQSELWITSGTMESTRLIMTLPAFLVNFGVETSIGNRVVLIAQADLESLAIVSDGTAVGTSFVPLSFRCHLDPSYSWNDGLSAILGPRIILPSPRGGTDSQVFSFNIETLTESLLATFVANPDGYSPVSFTRVGHRVYFTASDPDHGNELWQTDGTPEGTRMAADINPGADSLHPRSLSAVGDRLFFFANDGHVGHEPWVLDTCGADFNGDDLLNPDDLSDYINAYFNQAQGSRADFNADGVTNHNDLTDYLSAFFNGCG